MGFLSEKCIFEPITEESLSKLDSFSCGNDDLDIFFRKKSLLYQDELLGKSYCFVLAEDPDTVVCAFTLSNDSLRLDKLPNSRKKKVKRFIPGAKQMKRYPAVLIGRLGINKDYQNQHIGSDLMMFIKLWFVDPNNKTGCRFLLVDAYNNEKPLAYYERNGFEYLFHNERQEALFFFDNESKNLDTRFMIFDLIKMKTM